MNSKEQAYRAKATTAIDRALEHRNDAFRAKVLDMTLKNRWDVDDPAFLIVLSTGEMRVLLEQHPAQFEALMNRVFKQAESQFLSMHERVMAALNSSELTAQALELRINEVEQLISQERVKLIVDQQSLATRLETVAQHQVKMLEASAKKLTAEGFAVSKTQATQQVAAVAKQLREVHYWQTVIYACAAAAMLFTVGAMSGWRSRGLADQNSIWGDIQRWNQDDLKACQKAKRPTCNFHIEVPKD